MRGGRGDLFYSQLTITHFYPNAHCPRRCCTVLRYIYATIWPRYIFFTDQHFLLHQIGVRGGRVDLFTQLSPLLVLPLAISNH